MIVKNQYPICEFDTNKNPIIHPTSFLTESLPKKCVITYLRKELEQFVEENKLPIIGYLNSEVFDIPILNTQLIQTDFALQWRFAERRAQQ